MNEIRICDKCKGTNIKTLLPRLKQIDYKADILIGCQNLCGIGRNKSFAIVNHIPIIAENEECLVKKIEKELSK